MASLRKIVCTEEGCGKKFREGVPMRMHLMRAHRKREDGSKIPNKSAKKAKGTSSVEDMVLAMELEALTTLKVCSNLRVTLGMPPR